MGLFDGIIFKRAEDWIFDSLVTNQVPDSLMSVKVEPKKHYVSIYLRSMRIMNVRKGFKRFYGTVHSHVSLPYLGGKIEIETVTTPKSLQNVAADSVVDVVQFNHRLF